MRQATRTIILALVGLLLCSSMPALTPQADVARALDLKFDVNDKDVDEAMERLINFLWVRQLDDGSWPDVTGAQWKRKKGGTTALVVLAMLEAGVPLSDPKMEKAVDNLMAVQMDDTYCYAVRVMALSQAYRLAQRADFEAKIVEDLAWLTRNLPQAGAWGYGGPERTGDNSCSQYGLLALWEAEWAGFDPSKKVRPLAPEAVKTETKPGQPPFDPVRTWPTVLRNWGTSWRMIEKQWVERQRKDNGWTYAAVAGPDVESTMTMTAAGVASLYILIDEVYAPQMTPGKSRPKTEVFDRSEAGLKWLAERLNDKFTNDGYLAFGIQRIAAASGHKYIGDNDWFRLGVKEISRRATNTRTELDGPYGANVQAAFYLLFLARGRVPVTFNKLERPGTDWDAAPRDVANLTRYLIIKLEQRMSWQIVNVDRPVAEFLDAPILFVNGIQPLKLNSETVRKMREYVLRGGMIVGEATTSSATFAESFKSMMEEAFPEGKRPDADAYKWYQLPETHPILEGLGDPRSKQMLGPIWAMDDGTRTVAVLIPRDQATAWQHMDVTKSPHSFSLGLNLFKYATAGEPLRTRLRPVFVGRTRKADVSKKLGLMHAGPTWLSEEYAVERLSDKLASRGRVMVEGEQVADPASLDPRQTPLVWFNGRGDYKPSDAQIESLRQYVAKGGTVIINSMMGDLQFANSAKAMAKRILPDAEEMRVATTDTIFTGMVYRERGEPLDDPAFRFALKQALVKSIDLKGYRSGDRWGVIVSPYDTFLPLLGTPVWKCKGYATDTAQKIAANLYLYALENAEKGAEAPKP